MSASYSICRFAKPTKCELSSIEYFSDCDSFSIYDVDGEQTNERIRLFRSTDEEVANIVGSKFVRTIVLPEKVTNYEKLFREMGFDEKIIMEKKVHIKSSDGYTIEYTDGEQVEQIRYNDLQFYQMIIQTECIAIKEKCLWNSDDMYCYFDKNRIYKYIPSLKEYRFASVSNSMLSKAEIPFLIFERNKGKCFIEKY